MVWLTDWINHQWMNLWIKWKKNKERNQTMNKYFFLRIKEWFNEWINKWIKKQSNELFIEPKINRLLNKWIGLIYL